MIRRIVDLDERSVLIVWPMEVRNVVAYVQGLVSWSRVPNTTLVNDNGSSSALFPVVLSVWSSSSVRQVAQDVLELE